MYNAIATEPFFVLRLVVSLRLAYDFMNRITSQRRGANARNNWGGEYSYYAKTNKLEKVANGMGGESADKRSMSASGNLVYDSVGNLVEDKSKDLKISYDWRGMPVEFVHDAKDPKDAYKLLMAYDESGNRIWYSVEDADGSGYALATLPGVDVYYADRTSGSLGKFSLKRMDLVAGGFREGVNGAVYIPVADAQGNVWIIAEFDKRGSPYSYMHSISLQGVLW